MRFLAIILALSSAVLWAQSAGTIITVAGNGGDGDTGDGGKATNAELSSQFTAAADRAGNIYIADNLNNVIRKVSPAGIITRFGGGGSGILEDGVPAASVSQLPATGITTDAAGNVFLAAGGVVAKIDTAGILHLLTAFATGFSDSGDGGPAIKATALPQSIGVDAAGNIYICEIITNKIRKVDTNGIIHTIAGTGKAGYTGDGGLGTNAELNLPQNMAVDPAGNVYFADNALYVRKVDASGIITTVAGNGQSIGISEGVPAKSTGMVPNSVAADAGGNIFINDTARIRKVNAAGIINTVAGGITNFDRGDGGPATSASILGNTGVSVDNAGNLYIDQTGQFRLRKVFGVATPGSAGGAAPSIDKNGVVNGASFAPGLTIGSWASIQGSSLATGTGTWKIVNGFLPVTVDGVTVDVGGEDAYVYYVSKDQINFIVPLVHSGPQQVTVKNASGTSVAVTVTVGSYGPAFFGWPNHQVVATREDFSLAVKNGTFPGATTVPAKPGDTIILWGTGFGPTFPAYPQGQEVPSTGTYSTEAPPTITLGGIPAKVYGAALAPGFAGLYQIAIQVPPSLGNGDWPVVATIGGASSPAGMNLTVQK
ncbi:MAG TPA: hypothetical protein VFW44_13300 [Bryobacteraceae bacterium]|nr:hypothetical protein [Bryobacteraceae bacterium]